MKKMSFDLNPQQRKIVENSDGVVIIKAGPGTGKTKTLTSRVAFLIGNKNIDPQKILVLTFTNRAANEMKERLERMVTTVPAITTFHGFAFDLLSQLGCEINLISEEDRDKIIKAIKRDKKSSLSIRDLDLQISSFKSTLESFVSGDIKQLIDLYQKELMKRNLVDFDDLIINVFNYLKENQDFKSLLQQRFKHILIDEFQDTNDLQYQLIKTILGELPNFFVIGDPMQSIYGFRGADSKIFETLKDDFPQVKEEVLKINYRSCKDVVRVSNLLFPQVTLSANTSSSGRVGTVETLNEYTEAQWIINFINQKIGGSDLLKAKSEEEEKEVTFADFAIIYRTHHLAQALEKKLESSGFPYQIVKEETQLIGDHIKLLSMHAAKGLEFKYVFICGFEQGLIPFEKSQTQEELEEEKRLLYVGMTRAKEELYLLYTKKRGGRRSETSQFLKFLFSPNLVQLQDTDMTKIIKKAEASRIKKSQMSLF